MKNILFSARYLNNAFNKTYLLRYSKRATTIIYIKDIGLNITISWPRFAHAHQSYLHIEVHRSGTRPHRMNDPCNGGIH